MKQNERKRKQKQEAVKRDSFSERELYKELGKKALVLYACRLAMIFL